MASQWATEKAREVVHSRWDWFPEGDKAHLSVAIATALDTARRQGARDERERCVEACEQVRSHICCYSAPGKPQLMCDCKFVRPGSKNDEATGCCEIRQCVSAIRMLPLES